jgi:sugar lactone lactonase YvrE
MGHAITETTSGLVYQWESGALSEGFSDIWAACVTDYAKQEFAVTGENTWRIAEKCENVGATNVGFRDMSNPPLFSHPSAYKNPNWKPASLQTCRVLTSNNDECGVHSNSGVLNKWFFLITEGQAGTNSFGTPFAVTGLGFATSEKIAYLTSLNLTPNASYQTCRTVSLNATATLYGNTSAQYQSVWNAWVAVAVDSNVYNMSNTPVFATNNFTSIAVGKNGVVLAGTNYSGYYKFEDNAWTKFSDLPDVRFNDIKADYNGDFWMAQSGRLGTQNGGSGISGGVSYLKAPFTGPSSLYTVGAQADVPSRNGRCIYIDTFRNTALINPNVWVATLAYITSNASTSGMLGHGLNLGTPAFTKVNSNINIASGTVGCLTMSGNKTTIWTFVQANNGVNQLLTYDAVTNAFIASFDHISHPVIPSGFVARSIYCDAKGRTWVGLATGGILVYDERNTWHYLSGTGFPQLFPSGSQASFNAITGTKEGDVYIGTTTGIVYFERGDGLLDKIDQAASYKAFGKPNGLPSNVINAIAYDTSRFKLLVATDSGIVFWEPLCINPYCKTYKSAATTDVETTGGGNWSNTATWGSGKIPDSLTNVNIKHAITVDINGQCSSLIVSPPGSVNVAAGKKLVIYDQKEATIYSGNQRRKRR